LEGSGSGSGGAAKPPGGGADKGGAGASANKFKGVSGSQYKFGVLARYFISSKVFFIEVALFLAELRIWLNSFFLRNCSPFL
jgi:hypothetical protein